MKADNDNKRTALYRHWNREGRLLYVGISLNVISRLDQHAADSHWSREISNVTVEYFETRDEAIVAEEKAIKTESPIHNIIHSTPLYSVKERYRRAAKNTTSPARVEEMVMYVMNEEYGGRDSNYGPLYEGRDIDSLCSWFEIEYEYEKTRTDVHQVTEALRHLELRGDIIRDGDKWFLPSIGGYVFERAALAA